MISRDDVKRFNECLYFASGTAVELKKASRMTNQPILESMVQKHGHHNSIV